MIMPSFVCNQFSGGMNEVLSPWLLDNKTAVMLENADVDTGKLKGIPGPGVLSVTSAESFGHYGTRNRSVVCWYDRYYWSNNDGTGYGGSDESLGVPYPLRHPVLTKSTSSSGLSGRYKYCWCYVNANGWEGAPCAETGSLWEEIELSGESVTITAPSSFPSGVSYIKLYRTVDMGADFYCIGDIRKPNGEFVDTLKDTTLLMLEPASSFDNYPPPEGGKYLCESGGVFFLAVGSRLYFSLQGNPHAWPTLNFIGFDDTIRGITAEFQGVLVFTSNHTYRITGADDPETVIKTLIPGDQGCVNYRTIARVSNAPIWLSNDGICLWDGESMTVISHQVMDTHRLQVRYAVSANDCYYLFLLNGTIVFDHKNGDVFRRLSFTCDYAWYDGDSDRIYMERGGKFYEYGAGVIRDFTYISPYIGDSGLAYKQFTELVVSHKGELCITGILDGRESFVLEHVSGCRNRIKLPYPSTGKIFQVKITGPGELSEIAVLYE